jgi:hypothetical protein
MPFHKHRDNFEDGQIKIGNVDTYETALTTEAFGGIMTESN